MVKIVVFDSGLGSLSVIKSMQKTFKSDIVYFADQKNFPYGRKTKRELDSIIRKTVAVLRNRFAPDIIVIGSNTPTLILDITEKNVFGIKPPIREAVKITTTKKIAILSTRAAIRSRGLSKYIKRCRVSKSITIYKKNCSSLVDLVESGKFLRNKSLCVRIIRNTLGEFFDENKIDVATLSSTHLPFLKKFLHKEFPNTKFLDPADMFAERLSHQIKNKTGHNRLEIYTSGDTRRFQESLSKLGIRVKARHLSL